MARVDVKVNLQAEQAEEVSRILRRGAMEVSRFTAEHPMSTKVDEVRAACTANMLRDVADIFMRAARREVQS